MANLHWRTALSSRSAILLCIFSTVFSFNYSIEADEPELLPQTSSWQWLEGRREQVSRKVTALGRNLDAWLSGENIGENANETYLCIRLNQQAASFEGYHSRLKIDGSLDLPQTSKRWKLIFESDAAELNSLEGTVLGEEASAESIGGVSYQQKSGGSWQLNHSIGLRAKIQADPFYRFKSQYEKQMNEDWSFGYRQKIWHYKSQGWGYNTDISFNRKIKETKYCSFLRK